MERMSAEINVAWPDENRFHFQVLNFPPLFVVKMSIRTHETFFAFGVPEQASGKQNRVWQDVGTGEELNEANKSPGSIVELYPLQRGPSGNARFLARLEQIGCAGSFGVLYDAREWNSEGNGYLGQIIEQSGALGLGNVAGFEQIGKLRTDGSAITLPYCWFSAVDTWDNPSLCAVDTYDLSGEKVRFRAHVYNRPDLVPIAKAIEYAEKRDYPAVRSYCTSPQVARRLVRDIPPHVLAGELRVTHTGKGKERIEMGSFEPEYIFDVEKLGMRWLVVGFRSE